MTPQPESSKRIELDKLVIDFQRLLGSNWDRYQAIVSLFLVGKISRVELCEELSTILTPQTTRLHNQLLLTNLANALRDSPSHSVSGAGFGSGYIGKKRDGKRNRSSQYERIKKDIMALPARERRRVKSIVRDPGKRIIFNSSITLNRQALLPKIPVSANRESPATQNTMQWAQDIIHGFQSMLSTESYELPDSDTLRSKVVSIAREHGLIGGVNEKVYELILLGLELHLKTIIESAIDTVRYRRSEVEKSSTRKITLTLPDMYDVFTQFPDIVEPNGAMLRFQDVCVDNEMEVSPDKLVEVKPPENGSSASDVGSRRELQTLLRDLLV